MDVSQTYLLIYRKNQSKNHIKYNNTREFRISLNIDNTFYLLYWFLVVSLGIN